MNKQFLQIASSFLLAGAAFATQPAPVAADKAAPQAEKPAMVKKEKRKEAKAACLKETPSLKGSDLRKCVKGKING